MPMRAQSPSDTSLIALRIDREQTSPDQKRRKSVAVGPTEQTNGEGLTNLHRWSQSTSSSGPSVNNTRRSRASSGAVLPGLYNQAYQPHKSKRSTATIDYSPRASPQRQRTSRPASRRQQSPTDSPERERRRPSRSELADQLTALPPLHTTPGLTDPNDTESPSTIALVTPSAQSVYGQDYFGDDGNSPRSKAKAKKPVMIRNHTAPMSAFNSSRLQAVEGAQDAEATNRQSDPRGEAVREAAVRTRQNEEEEKKSKSQTTKEHRHKRSRTGEKGEKDKKLMLSKALQKANTAVLLDNAQNFEGALDAYRDACRLLQQVMDRSSGTDDKRKLDAIRVTYTNRIEELRQMEEDRPATSDEKSLPTRPMSDDSLPLSPAASAMSPTIDSTFKDSAISPKIDSSASHTPVIESAREVQIGDAPKLSVSQQDRDSFFVNTMQAVEDSTRTVQHRKSPSTSEAAFKEEERLSWDHPQHRRSLSMPEQRPMIDEPDNVNVKRASKVPALKMDKLLLRPESNYMPAPLSPRRPLSPQLKPEVEHAWEEQQAPLPESQRDFSAAPVDHDAAGSWLDTIDEKGSSRASSVHSVSSQQGLRRKHLRNVSGDSNPDFDAAFDAAVEAAYNEGLEPDLESGKKRDELNKKHIPKIPSAAPSAEVREISPPTKFATSDTYEMDAQDEEEERLLDEMTQDFAQTFNFDLSSKSALPRQSDSSGYSRSTWQSSQLSDRATAGTSLSTVNEDTLPPPLSKNAFAAQSSLNSVLAEHSPPPVPPPQSTLPRPPSMSQSRMSGVRGRRLSGQNPKQLKIETSTAKSDARKRASTFHHNQSPFKEDNEQEQKSALDRGFTFGAPLEKTKSDAQHDHLLMSPPSLELRSAISDDSRPMTATTPTTGPRESFDDDPGELITHRPVIKKNKSSVSLREHMVLLASPTNETGPSVVTPMSSTFMNFASKRQNEAGLASQRAALPSFGPTAADSLHSGGGYLFDTSLSTSNMPTSPKSPDIPTGLEPCPESFLLRPFWLMRNISSTITHPKGGFLTTRLFVPREVWLTKGVKLKSVEEKIANCDLLTAALGRLAGVDTYDADAVMEELQSFEEVMERVQNTFVKKLGGDVGISGLHGLFKDASGTTTSGATTSSQTGETTGGAEKTRSKEGKGYLNSWRKLRSKSSGAPIGGSHANKGASKAPEKDAPTMPTVPMTTFVPVERRGFKRDIRNLAFEGPNREYMGSLARLFDGVQVLGTPDNLAIVNAIGLFTDP